MAAINPGPLQLAIPAPPISSFVQAFNDPSKDPLQGQYTGLFDSFAINPDNAQASVSPQALRDLVAAAGNQRNIVALTYIHEGIAKVLLVCPQQQLDQALGAPSCILYGKHFAFEGDLFINQGLNLELPNDLFSLVGNQLLVPTAQVIQTAVAADANTKMLGPYLAGNAGTEIVRVRKIIPIPLKSI